MMLKLICFNTKKKRMLYVVTQTKANTKTISIKPEGFVTNGK